MKQRTTRKKERPMNPARRSIYVPMGKWETVWHAAHKKWGGSMSPLIVRLLEAYVQGRVDIQPEVKEDKSDGD